MRRELNGSFERVMKDAFGKRFAKEPYPANDCEKLLAHSTGSRVCAVE